MLRSILRWWRKGNQGFPTMRFPSSASDFRGSTKLSHPSGMVGTNENKSPCEVGSRKEIAHLNKKGRSVRGNRLGFLQMRGTGFEPAQALSYSLSSLSLKEENVKLKVSALKGCLFDHSSTLA